MATRIDGKAVAEDVIETVKQASSALVQSEGVTPGIAVVIVGEDPASQVYVASKSRKAKECGFHSVQHDMSVETTEAELLAKVAELNADPAIHGILVQLPLPDHIGDKRVIQAIDANKDVDGFHVVNAGKLTVGDVDSAFVPCTPAGSMLLIERVRGRDLSGLTAVVIGRSNIVGKPMASLLLAANATVYHRTQPHPGPAGIVPQCRYSGRSCRTPRDGSRAIGSSPVLPSSTSASIGFRPPERGGGQKPSRRRCRL